MGADRVPLTIGTPLNETTATPVRPARLHGLHPLLFAAYPVLFLWSQNLGEVAIGDVFPLLAIVVPLVAIATWLLGRGLGDIRRGALIVAPIVVGLLMFGHVVQLLTGPQDLESAQAGQTDATASIAVGIALAGAATLLTIAAFRLSRAHLATVDTALLRIAAILIVVTMVPIGSHLFGATAGRLGAGPGATPEPTNAGPSPSVHDASLPTSTTAVKRDVYWFVFDRYGSDRSLQLRYEIDNELTPWLADQGFTVLADSHANYVRTVLSMSTTLNMTSLERLDGWVGPDSSDLDPANAALQGSLVARQFKALGYRYVHVGSWWTPTSVDELADVNYNASDVSDFSEAVLDMSALPTIARLVGASEVAPSRSQRHYNHGRYEMNVLETIDEEPGPKFVMAHVLLPHPPLVFNRDGSFSPKETGRESLLSQFDYTNERLRRIIENLLDVPEAERPIIILQADEGPYPRPYAADSCCYDWNDATPEELEIKFGILNAWYVPGGQDIGLYPTMTAGNTFPTLFNGYFGLDYPLVEDRVFTSRSDARPFDLTDITDRLPSLP